MVVLQQLGNAGLSLAGTQVRGRAAQSHRLALLAILAAAHGRSVSRDKIIALLWPESPSDRARRHLSDTLYILRTALGDEAIRAIGDDVALNTVHVTSDVVEFDQLLDDGNLARAVALYRGPLLDGFHLSDGGEFERWLDVERARLDHRYAGAIEALARRCAESDDPSGAVEWWRKLAAHEPFSSRVALGLMRALEASGDRAGALRHARAHSELMKKEFDAEPDAEIITYAEQLRLKPPGRHADQPPSAPASNAGLRESRTSAGSAFAAGNEAIRKRASVQRVLTAFLLIAFFGVGAALLGALSHGGTDRLSPRAVAVLPFSNLSGNPEDQYFSDGLTDELINTLSQIQALRVVARSSSFAFRDPNRNVQAIGRALQAGSLVEGTVRKYGDRVRVSVSLTNVADGVQRWSRTYELRGTDVLAIQSDLAQRIAAAVQAEHTPGERARIARAPTQNPEAYDLYLKGTYFANQRSAEALRKAIDYFQRAIAVDSQFAAAYAGLANVYPPYATHGFIPPWVGKEAMRGRALKAVALDPDLADAHVALAAYLSVFEWDWAAGEREYQRAIALDPSNVRAHAWYSFLLASLRRYDEALREAKKEAELSPVAALDVAAPGVVMAFAGDTARAIAALRSAIELDSTVWLAQVQLGWAHEIRKEWKQAVDAYEQAARLTSSTSIPKADLARALVFAGREREAREILMGLKQETARTGVYLPQVATVLAALGETDPAVDWLEESVRQRHPVLLHALVEPGFESIRHHPRVVALLRDNGLPL